MKDLIHCGETPYLRKAKIINLWEMESYAVAMFNHAVVKVDLRVLAPNNQELSPYNLFG